MVKPTQRAIDMRSDIEKEHTNLQGHIGIHGDTLYMHNPVSGFNEVIDEKTLLFTGQSPY